MGVARLVITEKFYSDLLYSKILFDTLNVKKESRMMPAEKETDFQKAVLKPVK